MTYRNFNRLAPAALFAFTACGAPPPAEDPAPPGAMAHEGAAFEITEVRPGIWHAVGTGAMNVGANAAIVGPRRIAVAGGFPHHPGGGVGCCSRSFRR